MSSARESSLPYRVAAIVDAGLLLSRYAILGIANAETRGLLEPPQAPRRFFNSGR